MTLAAKQTNASIGGNVKTFALADAFAALAKQ